MAHAAARSGQVHHKSFDLYMVGMDPWMWVYRRGWVVCASSAILPWVARIREHFLDLALADFEIILAPIVRFTARLARLLTSMDRVWCFEWIRSCESSLACPIKD
mmetsp:Transcript_15598/g.24256  ORF Transcript_15598/g.24256 Transcript_15598/m.24256 type:complete len:105 (+) Transcript_15598:487-801(+)